MSTKKFAVVVEKGQEMRSLERWRRHKKYPRQELVISNPSRHEELTCWLEDRTHFTFKDGVAVDNVFDYENSNTCISLLITRTPVGAKVTVRDHRYEQYRENQQFRRAELDYEFAGEFCDFLLQVKVPDEYTLLSLKALLRGHNVADYDRASKLRALLEVVSS